MSNLEKSENLKNFASTWKSIFQEENKKAENDKTEIVTEKKEKLSEKRTNNMTRLIHYRLPLLYLLHYLIKIFFLLLNYQKIKLRMKIIGKRNLVIAFMKI